MRLSLIITLFCLQILRGYAQEKTLVSKNFKFKDGLYWSFGHFQKNKPDVLWDTLETRLVTNPASLMTHVEFLKIKKQANLLPLDSIYCLVIDGIPYLRLPVMTQKRSSAVFAGMALRGKLCYYQYEDIEEKQVQITAYIPETGQPYASKLITQKKDVVREKLLHFETGDTIDFTLNNFKELIKKDKDLLQTVNALKPKEVKEKLFKCLLIYNDRNPVYLF
jgi:hypothetical protein